MATHIFLGCFDGFDFPQAPLFPKKAKQLEASLPPKLSARETFQNHLKDEQSTAKAASKQEEISRRDRLVQLEADYFKRLELVGCRRTLKEKRDAEAAEKKRAAGEEARRVADESALKKRPNLKKRSSSWVSGIAEALFHVGGKPKKNDKVAAIKKPGTWGDMTASQKQVWLNFQKRRSGELNEGLLSIPLKEGNLSNGEKSKSRMQ
jgi:hypothetical protein